MNAKKVISATLQYALRCQYIYDNPLINVKLIPVNDESKEKEEKKKTITDEEFINLVNGVLSKVSIVVKDLSLIIKRMLLRCIFLIIVDYALEKHLL